MFHPISKHSLNINFLLYFLSELLMSLRIAFARFVVKSMGLIMAFVVFLERLVMTELEGPITNDQVLLGLDNISCFSDSSGIYKL